MKPSYRILIVALVLLVASVLALNLASAAAPAFIVVRWGDTLTSIATRYGTTVDALVSANRLPSANFIYAGQRLVLPGSSSPQASAGGFYIVRPGDTLYSIAVRTGTTVGALLAANGLSNPDFVWSGQQLRLAGAGSQAPASSRTVAAPTAGKWIDVSLSQQRFTAYEGTTPVRTALVSTGVAAHPTPVGRFATYVKLKSQTMYGGSKAAGDYYYLPDVPNVMYFYKDYALHGTYWHKNFGRPMSRGCVNLTLGDAEWMFSWAPLGTPVVIHN